MKNKWRVLILIAVMLIVVLMLGWYLAGRRPFRNLKAEEIASASMEIMPPDQEVVVEDLDELVSHLQQLVIYRRDQSYSEYAGQAVVITLEMKDGSRMEIVEYNPFVIIDGVGYRCKYEPSEQFNRYANQLMREAQLENKKERTLCNNSVLSAIKMTSLRRLSV